jgi:hypothetical protein
MTKNGSKQMLGEKEGLYFFGKNIIVHETFDFI